MDEHSLMRNCRRGSNAQRGRPTRVRVPSLGRGRVRLPPDFTWPNRVVWNLVCLGHQPELGGAWETYLRTSSIETADAMDRVFGPSLFWVTTRAINCPYCMGHCEFSLENAGLSPDDRRADPAARRRRVVGLPGRGAAGLCLRPQADRDPLGGLGRGRPAACSTTSARAGVMVLSAACRGHYMTRVSNGFQLSLERDNVFRRAVIRRPYWPQRCGEGDQQRRNLERPPASRSHIHSRKRTSPNEIETSRCSTVAATARVDLVVPGPCLGPTRRLSR